MRLPVARQCTLGAAVRVGRAKPVDEAERLQNHRRRLRTLPRGSGLGPRLHRPLSQRVGRADGDRHLRGGGGGQTAIGGGSVAGVVFRRLQGIARGRSRANLHLDLCWCGGLSGGPAQLRHSGPQHSQHPLRRLRAQFQHE